jgi:bifunctional DNA-binding transcriptional regulator/antitoxin component of YhaV-PrlF toxin-antitoxin module
MTMATVIIRDNGRITIPSSLLKKYALEEGNRLQLLDVGDGSFFLTPVESKVIKSADQAARKVKDANVSLEELFQELDRERRDYFTTHYACH